MKPLKIAVYYPWVYLKGGIERSMAALISRSCHDWTIFTSHYDPDNTFEEFSNFRIVKVGEASVKRNMGAVLKAAVNMLTTRMPLEGFDAYVVWCDGLGTLTTFRNSSIPSFCICSTPLRPVYDPVYAREALRSRKPLAKLAYHLFKHSFHLVDRLAWSRFDGVVATSLEVKERIVRHRLYSDDSRMVLHHPGIDVADAPAHVTYEPYFLVPGRISWTKNIRLAVEAFIKSGLPAPWRLVVAGFVDKKSQRHFQELQQLAQGSLRIEFVVNPSDQELNRLYESTYAVLFTPLNEDWGMAPLEGMLRAKAVIANASGGPLESVTDGVTGMLLPPDVDAWANCLRQIAEQPEKVQAMGAAARVSVKKYDWKNFVAGVDRLIANTVADPSVSKALSPHLVS
jgi:glycosyltransferase involved in cell wall biosynthesis